MTAKLLWHFDMELDGDHQTWVEDARFYVSTLDLAGKLFVAFARFHRLLGTSGPVLTLGTDSLGAAATQSPADAGQTMKTAPAQSQLQSQPLQLLRISNKISSRCMSRYAS